MEPLTFFASTVIFVGTFHLLSTAVDAVSKRRYESANQGTKTRNDWYCFFSLSNLFGNSGATVNNFDQPDLNQDAMIEEQKRRQQAQRPRLHIS